MQQNPTLWRDPATHLAREQPDQPVLYFDPALLQATARQFQGGFDDPQPPLQSFIDWGGKGKG